MRLSEGEAYSFSAGLFHETKVWELAVTLMEKTEVFDRKPRVMCPVGQEPDNDFNRYAHRHNSVIWDVFEEAVQALKTRAIWSWNEGHSL